MTISISCPSCDAALRIGDKRLGTVIKCPKCGSPFHAPFNDPTESQVTSLASSARQSNMGTSHHASTGRLDPGYWRSLPSLTYTMLGITGLFLALAFSLLIAALASSRTPTFVAILALLFGLVALLCGALAVQLLLAKQRAIAGKNVSILFGLGRIVVWEQNEGLVFQRDKRISDIVMGTEQGGGLRIIYPLVGEELKSRVPLSLQLTWFEDQRVLTREAVQLTVKIAIWWSIDNLEKYCFQIENSVNSLDNTRRPGGNYGRFPVARPIDRKSTAEVWIQTLAESCIRQLISETSTFLIVSKRASSGLPFEMVHGNSLSGELVDSSLSNIAPATPDVIANS